MPRPSISRGVDSMPSRSVCRARIPGSYSELGEAEIGAAVAGRHFAMVGTFHVRGTGARSLNGKTKPNWRSATIRWGATPGFAKQERLIR
jgi:hypothetical protein